MATNNNEQIRRLNNRVHLAGILAELENVTEGVTKKGVPYLSFRGVIQCGEDAVYSVKFRTFVQSKKSDGSESENFKKVKDWVASAIPMTKDKEKATKVDAFGSLADNPYVNSSNKLVESTQFSLQTFREFKDYAAEIDLEGFIHSIIDETRGEDELTGRQRMRLITQDVYRNTMDIRNIIIPSDYVADMPTIGYEAGRTANFFITLIPNDTHVVAKTGGIGVQRTNGASYLEWVMTGAEPPIEPDSTNALDSKLVKAAMSERKIRLAELENGGYQGSNKDEETASNRSGLGTNRNANNVKAKPAADITEDEDFPF